MSVMVCFAHYFVFLHSRVMFKEFNVTLLVVMWFAFSAYHTCGCPPDIYIHLCVPISAFLAFCLCLQVSVGAP